ncbi:MAG: hypothetical protein QXE79_03120 [Candidatus Bathyarchaeia archaeon]
MVRRELEQAIEGLRSLPESLTGSSLRPDLWRILERLEYAAFILSIGFGLMDYEPDYSVLEGPVDKDDPSELARLLDRCLEALDRDEPRICYDGVKALVKLLGSLIGRHGK